MNYKITFNLASSVSFTFRPVFDGLLFAAYCKYILMTKEGRQKYIQYLPEGGHKDYISNLPILRAFPQPFNIKPNEHIQDVLFPLTKHEKGYFMASYMFFGEHVEDEIFFKKNWDKKGDFVADFGKKKRKVRVNNAGFKSYNLPFPTTNTNQVWFYFQTEKIAEVEHLLQFVNGIGKKRNRGLGNISNYHIEELDFNPFEKVIRPIPVDAKDIDLNDLPKDFEMKLTGYKPPYWLPENQTYCIVK